MTWIDKDLDEDTKMINIKCLIMMIFKCINQHLSKIWSSNHEKVKQHWGWVEKKRCLWKERAAAHWYTVKNRQTLGGFPVRKLYVRNVFRYSRAISFKFRKVYLLENWRKSDNFLMSYNFAIAKYCFWK